jgi:hypothetical protein
LWVRLRAQDDLLTADNKMVLYPIPTELRLRCVRENDIYVPENPKPIMQRVVDRAKAKVARAPLKPFLDFVKTFLAMSDGWVMHDTMMEFFDMSEFGYRLKPTYALQTKTGLYEALANAKPDDHLFLLCLLSREVNYLDQRKVQVQGVSSYIMERQLKFEAFKALIEKFVRAYADIHKTVEIEPSAKARTNLV